jgi:hypothetical protein
VVLTGDDGICSYRMLPTHPTQVPKSFFKALKDGPLQGTYAVGECLVPISLQAIAGYQWSSDEGVTGPLLDGVLNYPLFQVG